MKLLTHHQHRPRQQGMAVIVVIALLSIIFLYVMANARTLHYLKRDLRLVEQQQTNRLHSAASIPSRPGTGAASVQHPAASMR
jgi:hypothetical protein